MYCRLYNNLLGNPLWLDDLHGADAIFFATHSQGSIVTTHLLDRLIRDKHIRTSRNHVAVEGMQVFPSAVGINIRSSETPQKVCCLALCGIHLGPLRYLSSSSLVQPYIQVNSLVQVSVVLPRSLRNMLIVFRIHRCERAIWIPGEFSFIWSFQCHLIKPYVDNREWCFEGICQSIDFSGPPRGQYL